MRPAPARRADAHGVETGWKVRHLGASSPTSFVI